MTDAPLPPAPRRLDSLDVMRGMTIAGMLLVNNPGSWGNVYWPLLHAEWNGWTFTDLVFPFFLFMVGVAMMLSFPKRLARGESSVGLFGHVIRRALALMILGWWGGTWTALLWPGEEGVLTQADTVILRLGYVAMVLGAVVLLAGTKNLLVWGGALVLGAVAFFATSLTLEFGDPLHGRIAGIRLPGVLVRIGWCYLFASAIYFLTPSWKAIVTWIAALLAIYWIWMVCIPIPGHGMPDLSQGFPTAETPRDQLFSNWCFFIDYHVLGEHVWSVRKLRDEAGNLIWSFDPEGILSTMSAICSVLFGVLAGLWLRRGDLDDTSKTNGMFVAGCWLCLAGLVMSIWFPINKRIWTSSYTVFTAGMALLTLAMCYHVIDVQGFRRWAAPFRWYGRNAIFAFVASGMMAATLGRIRIPVVNDAGVATTESLKSSIYSGLLDMTDHAKIASLIFAVAFVTLWALICALLDRRRIYFKI